MACCLSILSCLRCNHDVELYWKSPPLRQFIHQTGNLFCSEGAMITREVSNDFVSRCKTLGTEAMRYNSH